MHFQVVISRLVDEECYTRHVSEKTATMGEKNWIRLKVRLSNNALKQREHHFIEYC